MTIREFRIPVNLTDPKVKNADVANAVRARDLQEYVECKASWRTVIEVTYVENGVTYLWAVLTERT